MKIRFKTEVKWQGFTAELNHEQEFPDDMSEAERKLEYRRYVRGVMPKRATFKMLEAEQI